MRTFVAPALLLFLLAPIARAEPPDIDNTDEHPGSSPLDSKSQEGRSPRNTLYVELEGSGGLFSVNYERFISENVSFRLGGGYDAVRCYCIAPSSAGGSMVSYGPATDAAVSHRHYWDSALQSLLLFPVTFSYQAFRHSSHALELGAGATIVHLSFPGSSTGAIETAIIGYRYAPAGGGLNVRAAFTPSFIPPAQVNLGGPWFLWRFGLALGYGF